MSGSAVRTQEVPVPEPDLTPEAVIERARALVPAIREQQDEAERLGHHTAEPSANWPASTLACRTPCSDPRLAPPAA